MRWRMVGRASAALAVAVATLAAERHRGPLRSPSPGVLPPLRLSRLLLPRARQHHEIAVGRSRSVSGPNYDEHQNYDATRNGDFRHSTRTIGRDRRGWPSLSTRPDPSPAS